MNLKSILAGGYDPKLFTTKPDESLQCAICQFILRDPAQCLEGHLFCKSCIDSWLLKSNECPCCRGDIRGKLAKNRFVASQIDKLEVTCQTNFIHCASEINNEHCDFQGALCSLDDHIKICDFRMENCPNANYIDAGEVVRGCQEIMERRRIEIHKSHCDHKLVFCEFCREDIRQIKLEAHKSQFCTERPTCCPNDGCNEILIFSELQSHSECCRYELILCPLYTMDSNACSGCNGLVRRMDLECHVFNPSKLFSAILAINSKLAQTSSALEEVQEALVHTVKDLKRTKEQLGNTTHELENTKNDLEYVKQQQAGMEYLKRQEKPSKSQKQPERKTNKQAFIRVGAVVRVRNISVDEARKILEGRFEDVNPAFADYLGSDGTVVECFKKGETFRVQHKNSMRLWWPKVLLEVASVEPV